MTEGGWETGGGGCMQQNLCKYGVFHAIRRISYDTALLHIRGSVADGAGVLFLFSKKISRAKKNSRESNRVGGEGGVWVEEKKTEVPGI